MTSVLGRWGRAAALAGGLVSVLATTGPVWAVPEVPGRPVCAGVPVVAHRGGHDAAHTEDTRDALVRGARLGASVVEGDLHLTRDHHWVLLHDDRVDRTTDGRGAIESYTLAASRRLLTNDARHGVGTVRDVLTALAGHPAVGLQLEIKPRHVAAPDLTRLLRLFGRFGVHDRLLITSYSPDDLRDVIARSPGWHTALITDDPRPDLALAVRLGEALVADVDVVDRTYVVRAHRVNLQVYPWGVNSRSSWRRMVGDRADALITDRLQAVQSWCGQERSARRVLSGRDPRRTGARR